VFARNDSERFKNYSLFWNVFREVSGLSRSFLVRFVEVRQHFFEIFLDEPRFPWLRMARE
jgi:hypothetical protein